jgi:hypothetical protein
MAALASRASEAEAALGGEQRRFRKEQDRLSAAVLEAKSDREATDGVAHDLASRLASLAMDNDTARRNHEAALDLLRGARWEVKRLLAENASLMQEVHKASSIANGAFPAAVKLNSDTSVAPSNKPQKIASGSQSSESRRRTFLGETMTEAWRSRNHNALVERIRRSLLKRGITHKELLRMFRHFDHDGSGELELHEFAGLVSALKLGFHDGAVADIFRIFDHSGDGKVEAQEFVDFVFPGGRVNAHLASPVACDAGLSHAVARRDNPGCIFIPGCRRSQLVCPACGVFSSPTQGAWADHVWRCAREHGMK